MAWDQYLTAIGAPVQTLNVAVPDFFKQLESQLKQVSLDDWKTYLSWHVIHSAAPILPSAFVNENFEFYGKALTGCERASAPMEAMRSVHGLRSRRSTRPEICRTDLR